MDQTYSPWWIVPCGRHLFVTIELLVDQKRSSVMKGRGKGLEQVKKENLSWVCNFYGVWSALLLQIAYMWITTRGRKTHRIKEDYKIAKKQTVKRKRSLCKELAMNEQCNVLNSQINDYIYITLHVLLSLCALKLQYMIIIIINML